MTKKYKQLLLSIFFDSIGMLSFVIPGIGEFSDVIWAPVSVYIITKMYKGTVGKIGGVVSFLEEIGIFGCELGEFSRETALSSEHPEMLVIAQKKQE